jgi:tRNA/rRNA methyltransferase
MAFWAYILRCADGSYYAGHTDDLEQRIAQHHHGYFPNCYTLKRRPLELAWSDEFPSRIEALEAERKIKGWSRVKKEALIAGDWDAIQRLAQRRTSFETGLRKRSVPPQDERTLVNGSVSPTSVRAEEAPKPKAEGPSRSTPAPIIVLVRPQLGENIGKAARAMLNFGLTELRLVAPRDGWPNPSAGPAAAGADLVLERASVHETLAEAVADCAHVYATTVRKRGVSKPVLNPEEAAQAVRREPGRSAFVFGPERSGLETDDVALARAIVTVPINPEFGSLNLAQAVILLAYEWSKTAALTQPPLEELLPPAPQEELEGMILQLEAMLEPCRYFFPHSRAEATRRTLRTMLTKPGWNHLEVRTMRGVLTTLAKGPRTPRSKP